MISEAEKRAQYKYDRNNTKQVILKLNKKYDSDVIDKLNSVENKQGFIKNLIRNEIKNRKQF